MRRDDILLLAAGLAFYALVSVIPMTILALWVAGLIAGDQRIQELARALARIAPKDIGADQALQRVAELGSRLGVVAAITALWPATSYGSGLERSFHRLSGTRRKLAWGLRGRSLFFLFLLPLFILGSLAASFAGSAAFGEGAERAIGVVVALVTGLAGAAAALVVIYRIFPPTPLPWGSIWRVTLATAGGISILSAALWLFLSLGANFQEHYATSGLAGLVLLALWLFLSNALVLVGYKMALDL
jgi:membrane protein